MPRLTDIGELASGGIADADKAYVVDVSDTTQSAEGSSKWITFTSLWGWIQSKFAAATAKTTPIDADSLGIVDSAASNVLKQLTFANLWAWISSKFASPPAIGGTTPAAGAFTTLSATTSATLSGNNSTQIITATQSGTGLINKFKSTASDYRYTGVRNNGTGESRYDIDGQPAPYRLVNGGITAPTNQGVAVDFMLGVGNTASPYNAAKILARADSDYLTSANADASLILYTSANNTYQATLVLGSDNNVTVGGDLTVSGNNIISGNIDSSGNVKVVSAALLGYGTGAGGTVTQATSKSTAVTLNKPVGRITTNNAALGAESSETFTLNNSLITTTSIVHVSVSGNANHRANVESVDSGTALIRITNTTALSKSEAVNINFIVFSGATS